MLAWAAIIVPLGQLQDRFGSRQMYIIGLVLFLIASIITGLAPNITWCIVGRLLQGAAGAFYAPATYTLIHQTIPEGQRGKTIGLVSLGIGLGLAIGPTLGGIILSYVGWRWIFFINIPFCLFSLLIILRVTQSEPTTPPTTTFDRMSCSFLTLGIPALIYASGQIGQFGMDPLTISLLILGILLLFLFIRRQKRITNPLIHLSIFKNKAFTSIIIAMLFEQFAFSTSMIFIALYLQKILNYSILETSLIFFGLSATFGGISPIAGRAIDKFGIQKLASLGFLAFAFSLFLLTLLPTHANIYGLVTTLVIMGLSMGAAFNALNTGIILVADNQHVNISMSVFMLFALLGNVIAVLVTTICYTLISTHHLVNVLGHSLTPQQIATIQQMILHIGTAPTYLSQLPMELKTKIKCVALLRMRFGRRDPSAPFALARRLYHAAAVRVTGATCTSHTAHRLSHDSTPA